MDTFHGPHKKSIRYVTVSRKRGYVTQNLECEFYSPVGIVPSALYHVMQPFCDAVLQSEIIGGNV